MVSAKGNAGRRFCWNILESKTARIADVATFVAEEISVKAEKRKTGLPGLWNISDPDPAVRI